jgi:hypothetical protein
LQGGCLSRRPRYYRRCWRRRTLAWNGRFGIEPANCGDPCQGSHARWCGFAALYRSNAGQWSFLYKNPYRDLDLTLILSLQRGVPVATVGINNSTNAALLAIRILALSDPKYAIAIEEYRANMERVVLEKGKRLDEVGWTLEVGK